MAILRDEAGNIIYDEAGNPITDEAGGTSGTTATVSALSLSLTVNAVGISASTEEIIAVNKVALSLAVKGVAGFSTTIEAGLLSLSLAVRGLNTEQQITEWLKEQFEQKIYAPQRKFYIGTSDYSDRVMTWPKIRRTANEFKSVKIKVPLANDDGNLNTFFETAYSLQNTVSIQLGDTHPTSGWEDIDLFTGKVFGVEYKSRQCVIEARDRLWDMTERKVGDTDSVVNIPDSGGIAPSEIAWILCTCYGELSKNESGLNPDIDLTDFNVWAAQFSADSVLAHGRYDGQKIAEALDDLAQYTDSAIIIEGDGKIHFHRFTEVNSNDYTWPPDKIIDLSVDVNKRRLTNKQWVYWDYSVESGYYAGKVFAQNTTSVNTFGLHEEIFKKESIWYVDSVSALNIAQRKTSLFSEPPKYFELETGLDGIWRKIGETARFVDSFFNVTSASGWRIVEEEINLDDGSIIKELDEATVLDAFYLDESLLDGDDYLL